MKTERLIVSIIICASLLLVIFLFYINRPMPNQKRTTVEPELNAKTDELTSMMQQMITYQNHRIDSVQVHENGEYLSFKNALNRKKLVLFYPQHFCGECTEYDLDNFKKLSDQYPEQTVLISTQLQKRELLFFTKEHKLKCKYYNVHLPANDLLNDIHEPCYFLVGKDLSISLFFNPDMSQMDMTDFYFSKVKMILKNE